MSNQMTCVATPNVTSSQELLGGASPPGLPVGLKTGNCGPAPVPVNPSALLGVVPEVPTSDTSGQPSSTSLLPADLQSSWESRLRQRLAKTGSTECVLTWRASVTPAGRSLSRLVPLMRPTAGTASGLWPVKQWPTPAARDYRMPNNPEGASRANRPPTSGKQLPNEVVAVLWPTPTATDAVRGVLPPRPQDTGVPLGQRIGQIMNGSGEAMEKLGGLNPAFVCWLMGFPGEWGSCAPTAMPSSRKSRQK